MINQWKKDLFFERIGVKLKFLWAGKRVESLSELELVHWKFCKEAMFNVQQSVFLPNKEIFSSSVL